MMMKKTININNMFFSSSYSFDVNTININNMDLGLALPIGKYLKKWTFWGFVFHEFSPICFTF